MLVVSRKCQEVVVVGGTNGIERLLKVTVLAIENGKVRLGFETEEDVAVNRLEVWERIHPKAAVIGVGARPRWLGRARPSRIAEEK